MLETLLDALIDTAMIVPILLLVYILISYFTHHTQKPFKLLTSKGKYFGPLVGSALGTFPQCGFSAIMADLYSKRAITLGTLFAVFLATSDEALPILISNPVWYKELFILLGVKFLIGILFGYAIDFILQLVNLKKAVVSTKVRTENKVPDEKIDNILTECHTHSCSCGNHNNIESESYRANSEKKNIKCCADNIFLDALTHTARIAIYILIFNIIFGIVIYYVGMDNFISFVSINPYLQPLVTPLIGLIPNCAASVFITELFMAGGITLPAAIAGLSTGSGVGVLILFKQNKSIKENLLILISLYIIGVAVGLILTPIF